MLKLALYYSDVAPKIKDNHIQWVCGLNELLNDLEYIMMIDDKGIFFLAIYNTINECEI